MARFDKGWVKLHRKAINSAQLSDFTRIGVFTTLLMWANHKPAKIKWRGTTKNLAPGDVVTSISKLSKHGHIERKTVREILDEFEHSGMIETDKTTHGIVISIANWAEYQTFSAEYFPPNQDHSVGRQTDNQENMAGHMPSNQNEWLSISRPTDPSRLDGYSPHNKNNKEFKREESSTRKFHWSKTEEGEAFKKTLFEMFGKTPSPTIRANIFEIGRAFEFDIESLIAWNNAYSSTPDYKSLAEKHDPSRFRRKCTALLCEVGLIDRKGADATA